MGRANRYLPARVDDLGEYTPADTVYDIRLDANENPYPLPDYVIKEFRKCLDGCDFNRYPDSGAADLIREFSAVHRIKPDYVVAGNGSDELISLLLNLFLTRDDRMAVTEPDFSMYAFYARLTGCEILCHEKTADGAVDFKRLAALVNEKQCRVVILSNPCNPTGRAYDRDTILDFVKAVDCVVIVDEAYMEFCREGCSVLDMCGENDNLIVLRTLSKAYGGAGLRIGFSVSAPGIASALRKVKSPYNLNTVSQMFGKVLLKNQSRTIDLTASIAADTQKLYSELLKTSDGGGFTPLETDANFVLLAFDDDTSAERIYSRLKENGIIIRCPDCRHLRITCGSPRENDILIREFNKIIKENKSAAEKE